MQLVFGLIAWAWAGESRVAEEAYGRTVDLIDRLYLYPEKLDAPSLLQAAADGTAHELHWLVVEHEADGVYLRHGGGAPIGSVSVGQLATLPNALQSLEEIIAESGYPLHDTDVRLELLKGMTGALDKYSRVLVGDRLDRFDVRLKGTLVGIGASVDRRDGKLLVTEITKGSPAENVLKIGDQVLRIDGISTVNMPVQDASARIRGDIDSTITLVAQRGSRVLELNLVRTEIIIKNVEHRVLAENVGYIKIDHFSQKTIENLTTALDTLRHQGALSKGLVIDLRHNTGGSMKEAARAADLFLSEGLLLRTAGPDGDRVQNLQARIEAIASGDEPNIPIAVLIDEETASGSEIMAGALLELGRAVVIGYPSFGKGTVQKIYNLDDTTRLKLTVAQYILENDRRIAEGGIVPDAVLAPVEVDPLAIRFRGWEESKANVSWDRIIPVVGERDELGVWNIDPETSVVELARRTVVSATGTDRNAGLQALARVLPTFRAEQESRLSRIFESRKVNWNAAQTQNRQAPDVSIRLVTEIQPDQPDVVRVIARIENRSDTPIFRSLIELECDSFEPWSGLVIPIGKIEANGQAIGRTMVRLPPGIESREDLVRIRFRSDGRPAVAMGDEVLRSGSSPIPRLSASAQLSGAGSLRRAQVTLKNLGNTTIENLELSFGFPENTNIELLDPSVTVGNLIGKAEVTTSLNLQIAASTAVAVPLTLDLMANRLANFAEWPLHLPLTGAAITVEPPRVYLKSAVTSAPIGRRSFPLVVSDERELDHVVVFANGEKVAWIGPSRGRIDLRAEFTVQAGANRMVVIAEDDQGLVTRKVFNIRGESQVSVDAAEE